MKWLFIILILSSCTSTRTVVLDGSKSYDIDGKVVKYHWTGANIINADSVTTTAKVKRGDVITLTVTDNEGATNDTSKTIE